MVLPLQNACTSALLGGVAPGLSPRTRRRPLESEKRELRRSFCNAVTRKTVRYISPPVEMSSPVRCLSCGALGAYQCSHRRCMRRHNRKAKTPLQCLAQVAKHPGLTLNGHQSRVLVRFLSRLPTDGVIRRPEQHDPPGQGGGVASLAVKSVTALQTPVRCAPGRGGIPYGQDRYSVTDSGPLLARPGG